MTTASRWTDDRGFARAIRFDGRPAIVLEDDGYGSASFHTLKDAPLSELLRFAKENAERNPGSADFPALPLHLYIDYTDPEYFEEVAAGQYVRPGSGISFFLMDDESICLSVAIARSSTELTWPQMELMLSAWTRDRPVELVDLRLYHEGHPHNWEAYFSYAQADDTVGAACELAVDAVSFTSAYERGSLSRENLVAMLRSGQASSLVGMSECRVLEVKRPIPLEDALVQFEIAKDIAAIANSPTGGVLVIGAETKHVSTFDVIKRIIPLANPHADREKLRKILNSKIYPPLIDVDIEAVSVNRNDEHEMGCIVMIDIPPQPAEFKPILVHGASIAGKVRDIFVSVPTRQEDRTTQTSLASLHARLVAGSAWIASRTEQANLAAEKRDTSDSD